MSPACSLAVWQRNNTDIENRRNNTSVIDKAHFKVWVIVPAQFIRSNHLEMVVPPPFLCIKLREQETGSGCAADSKLCYMIQFSILMLCAIYQEAGHCGS